ncbi:hypothetical protein [Achromobacter sp. AONIH1]|uniref:hypothetical protein n=1 Tax=Achromobacter sp. AONIH1 TaxID=1758194 RepID=UPI001F3B3126|nr:hypothetical protein [Achromobacter sp. AONIH1]
MAAALNRGCSKSELALQFDCSTVTIRDTLAILDCPANVKNALESGNITLTHVKTLVKLQPDEQRAKEAELVAAGNGAKPHAHSRRQAAVLGASPASNRRNRFRPRLLRPKAITQLRWVLEDEDVEPESAPEAYWDTEE